MPISSEHFRALTRLYRRFLRGSGANFVHWRIGELRALVSDADGWRFDWIPNVRSALTAATEAHLTGLIATAEFARLSGVPAADAAKVRAVLMPLWGLSEHALSIPEIHARTGVSERTISRWEATALGDPVSLALLGRLVEAARRPADEMPGVLSEWRGEPTDWPPVDRRAQTLEAFRTTHGIVERAYPREDLLALRKAAAIVLLNYLGAAERTDLYRQVDARIADLWRADDPLSFSTIPDRPDVIDADVTRATLAALAQFACAEVATRSTHSELVDEAYGNRSAVGEFLELSEQFSQPTEGGLVVIDRSDARADAIVKEFSHETPTLDLTSSGQETIPADDPIVDAFRQSVAIRRAKVSSPERLDRERIYVAKRVSIRAPEENPDSARGRRAMGKGISIEVRLQRLLALADQSVSLALLDDKQYKLMRELRGAIRASGGSQVYTELTVRDAGLALSKRHLHASGIARILEARVSIKRISKMTAEEDQIAVVESLQQTSLSAGGIAIQVVESLVQVRDGQQPATGLAAYAKAALGWSWDALRMLDEVESRLTDNERTLRSTREGDWNIAWQGWRAAAGVQRLRCQLVVRAAINSGLLNDNLWNSDALDCSIPSIVEGYRTLLTLKEFDRGNADRLVIQSIWLAMLNNGQIPVEKGLPVGLRDMPHFVDAVQLVAEGLRRGALDVRRFRSWVLRRGFDIGGIGTLPLDGPVARELEISSGGRYLALRGEALIVRHSSSMPASARRGGTDEFDGLGTSAS